MSDLPAAAWYTDPEDDSQYRYWDGSAWTEHRAPRHTQPEHQPQSPQIRRPTRLVADTFSLVGRRWRGWVAPALIYLVGEAVAVVLMIIGANRLLMGELGEIWDRVTDPDFDVESPEQTAYFESLEFDLSLVNFVPMVLAVLVMLVLGSILQAAVARVALSDLRDQPLTASEALRLALGRIPRLLGVDFQVILIGVIAVAAVGLAGSAVPLLWIPLIPAFIAAAVYGTVVMMLAYVVASVGPATPSLRYGVRLVRRRFWPTLGRMLLMLAVLTGFSLVIGLVSTIGGASALAFVVASQVIQAVVGVVIAVVALVAVTIIYHDLGGESD